MKRVAFIVLFMAGFFSIGAAKVVYAETYNVSAVVPFKVPTIAAVIDSPLSNSALTSSSARIAGTCEVSNPANVVVIMRSGSDIGSASCSATGRFELDITLLQGSNTLIARTSNVNSQYGPDSPSVTVNYAVSPQNSSPTQAASDGSSLDIGTDQPFIPLQVDQKIVQITVGVTGGSGPYLIELNWGDGSVEQKKVDIAGTYTFTHEYKKSMTYRVQAIVTDVLGVSRAQSFVVLSAVVQKLQNLQSQSGAIGGTGITHIIWWTSRWVWFVWIIAFCCGILLGMRYMKRKLMHELAAGKKKRGRS